MPDQDDAFAALAAEADAAFDDRANGHALGIGQNFRRDGVVRALSFLEDSRGIVDAFLHVGRAAQKGGGEEQYE